MRYFHHILNCLPVFVLFSFCAIGCAQNAEQSSSIEDDPLIILLDAYMKTPADLSAEEKLSWADNLYSAASAAPHSPAYFQVIIDTMGICNSAGNTARAVEIGEEALTVVSDNYEKSKLHLYLGGFAAVALHAKKEEKNNADAVIRHYGSYIQLYNQFDAADKKNDLVSAISCYKELGDVQSGTLKQYSSAVENYDKALELFASYPEEDKARAVILRSKAFALAHCRGEEAGINAMMQYGQSNALDYMPKSYYACDFADEILDNNAEHYKEFLLQWVDTAPRDARTFLCLMKIADKCMKSNDYKNAILYYEGVREHYWEDVMTKDANALQMQRGDYASLMLPKLASAYLGTGDIQNAEKCFFLLKELVPKDAQIPFVQEHIERAMSDHENAEFIRRIESGEFKSGRPWGIIIGVNAVFIALIIFLLLMQRRKR